MNPNSVDLGIEHRTKLLLAIARAVYDTHIAAKTHWQPRDLLLLWALQCPTFRPSSTKDSLTNWSESTPQWYPLKIDVYFVIKTTLLSNKIKGCDVMVACE